uniref:G-protein coupled receptors family 1 profile domain-containing protein n=1 Tax=Ditylenchus dipsaci TaxID=166011 RepID=A0A915CNM8_9BILA
MRRIDKKKLDLEFELYYNCTSYDVNSIGIEKRQHIFVGLLYICLGLGNEMMYIPCVWALWRLFSKDRSAPTCYKLMFYLGIVDCLGIICQHCSLEFGVCRGQWLACWLPLTTYCYLSINRCMVIYDTDLADSLFRGRRFLAVNSHIWVYGFVWLFPPSFITHRPSAIFNHT